MIRHLGGTNIPIRAIPILAGGFLVHLTLGTVYTTGNMVPYLVSYLRFRENESVTYSEMAWFTALSFAGQGSAISLGGVIERKLGPRLAVLIGCAVADVGLFVTYFTIKVAFWLSLITYALLFGFGVGMAYAPPIACAMKWLPNHKGLATGCIVGGFGLGAFIFDQVQTTFINPTNFAVDSSDKYFHEDELLNRVPYVFLLLGGIYVAMQLVGTFLLVDPPNVNAPVLKNDSEATICSSTDKKTDEEHSVPVKELLRSPTFYILWIMFFFISHVTVLISTYWKSFGQTFMQNDYNMALAGSFSSVFSFLGRLFWGHIGDRFSFQVAMSCITSLLTMFLLTFQLASDGGYPMYFIWVCGIYFTLSGSFSCFPLVVAKCFGTERVAVYYGFLFMSQAVAGVLGALAAQELLDIVNYRGMFYIIGGITYFCFFLTTLLSWTRHGRIKKPEAVIATKF